MATMTVIEFKPTAMSKLSREAAAKTAALMPTLEAKNAEFEAATSPEDIDRLARELLSLSLNPVMGAL